MDPETSDVPAQDKGNTAEVQQRRMSESSRDESLERAIRLVQSDPEFRQARANLEYVEESIRDPVANFLAIAQARDGIRYVEGELERYQDDVPVAAEQLAAAREQRHDLLGRFVEPFLDGRGATNALFDSFDADILEAVGQCMGIQDQLEEERERWEAVEERQQSMRTIIEQIEDHLALDKHS
ncbi:hypothetical protein LTR36_006473 [Oleoguttula mirabilis]|uniref:Uncharacterized protein n=1 Tax=Oleoguttula mirabilis TaxID=1507867 RepID=A0AAV9JUX7_9PEZI|nr:hypothetical protein LTR36_006473 [Oleoguttula mirabilis]